MPEPSQINIYVTVPELQLEAYNDSTVDVHFVTMGTDFKLLSSDPPLDPPLDDVKPVIIKEEDPLDEIFNELFEEGTDSGISTSPAEELDYEAFPPSGSVDIEAMYTHHWDTRFRPPNNMSYLNLDYIINGILDTPLTHVTTPNDMYLIFNKDINIKEHQQPVNGVIYGQFVRGEQGQTRDWEYELLSVDPENKRQILKIDSNGSNWRGLHVSTYAGTSPNVEVESRNHMAREYLVVVLTRSVVKGEQVICGMKQKYCRKFAGRKRKY